MCWSAKKGLGTWCPHAAFLGGNADVRGKQDLHCQAGTPQPYSYCRKHPLFLQTQAPPVIATACHYISTAEWPSFNGVIATGYKYWVVQVKVFHKPHQQSIRAFICWAPRMWFVSGYVWFLFNSAQQNIPGMLLWSVTNYRIKRPNAKTIFGQKMFSNIFEVVWSN